MEYQIDDKQLDASVFLSLVNQVWPNDYDVKQTEEALAATMNITAYDGEKLVGCLRILTDGYFFGTITELLILPAYQKRGSVDIGQAGQLGMQLLLSEAAAIGAVIGASVSWIFKRYLANKE